MKRTSLLLLVVAFAAVLVLTACRYEEPTLSTETGDAPPTEPPYAFATQTAVPRATATPATPPATPTATPRPTPPPATPQTPVATPLPVTEQLRINAEQFNYEIGAYGGDYTVATISEPLTFNLALANDASSSDLLSYVFEGLTETSWLTDRVEPALAKSWETSEDGLTWTFHLREDVRWHDGRQFTAADVEFTFNRIIYNEDIPTPDRSTFNFRYLDDDTGEWKEAPMTVVAIDEFTIVCVLPQPFAPFLRSMGTAIYPKHILEKHVKDGTFVDTWDIRTDPREVIGTGPFTIESYRPGEQIDLIRNDDYWLQDAAGNTLPYLDRIIHRIVPEIDAELNLFLAGLTDIHGVLGHEYEDLEPLQEPNNFTLHRRGPTFGTTFLALNMNTGIDPDTGDAYMDETKRYWFSNQQFRQAIAHVVDKDQIIVEAQDGFGYPQWAHISPAAGDFHNPGVRKYYYDVDQANEILDELGWTDTDGDGIREDDQGNPIAFDLRTNQGNNIRETVGSILLEGFQDIGLDVDYQAVDFGELVNQLTSTYDWDTIIIGLTGGSDPHGGMVIWHSGESLHLWNPNQDEPATEWEARVDELYIKASRELDRQKRIALYHEAQAITAENVPLIYTTLGERITAIRNVFGNTTATLYGLFDARYVYRTD